MRNRRADRSTNDNDAGMNRSRVVMFRVVADQKSAVAGSPPMRLPRSRPSIAAI